MKMMRVIAFSAVVAAFAGCAHREMADDSTPVWTNSDSANNGGTISGQTGTASASNGDVFGGANASNADASTSVAAPNGYVQSYSVTVGCSGTYYRTDARGRRTESGRAYNSGVALVRLDARGQRGRDVAAATGGQSLYFQPDCNCGALQADAGHTQMAANEAQPVGPQCVAGG